MSEKECTCITHEGPHWLHMDYITKLQNVQHLLSVALDAYRAGDYRNGERYLYEYANAEKRRLDEKLRNMKEGESYPYSMLGNVEDVQAMALDIHRQIGDAIEQARAKYNVEIKQEALF